MIRKRNYKNDFVNIRKLSLKKVMPKCKNWIFKTL